MTDELSVNRVFQLSEEQGFSLAGNQPIGGRGAAGIGSALLGAPPALDPQAPQVKRPGLYDTTGGQMVKDLLAKRKNLKWWTPDFMADRNERDLNTALRLAAADMGGAEGQLLASQAAEDREDKKLASEAAQSRWEAEMKADEGKRRAEIGRLEADAERMRAQALAPTPDVAEGRRPRDRFLSADGALYDTSSGKWLRPPEKAEPPRVAPKGGRPPWEEAFQKALPNLLKEDIATGKVPTEEEILKQRDIYGRPFEGKETAPGLEGAGRSAAPVAINPKTGEQIQWVDGKWVPVR